eukprot:scaffold39062_cov75-Phaeocystis_antarctica.AAC.2
MSSTTSVMTKLTADVENPRARAHGMYWKALGSSASSTVTLLRRSQRTGPAARRPTRWRDTRCRRQGRETRTSAPPPRLTKPRASRRRGSGHTTHRRHQEANDAHERAEDADEEGEAVVAREAELDIVEEHIDADGEARHDLTRPRKPRARVHRGAGVRTGERRRFGRVLFAAPHGAESDAELLPNSDFSRAWCFSYLLPLAVSVCAASLELVPFINIARSLAGWLPKHLAARGVLAASGVPRSRAR